MVNNPVLARANHLMEVSSQHFKIKSQDALKDDNLQQALIKLKSGFVKGRRESIEHLPEFDAMRDRAHDVKNHTLENLDIYLTQFEQNVINQGGKVHWARNANEANKIIASLCQRKNISNVVKSKSMLTEEIGLNSYLEQKKIHITETDLGEYILQIRNDQPSHIVTPAIHILKEQMAKDFKKQHSLPDKNRSLTQPESLLLEARQILREKFINADAGITGANCLIAESGTVMMVTNEGNGDLTQTLPATHIVVAGIEKVVPTMNDAMTVLRLLARSAIGQEITSYTTFTTGARRSNDIEGPRDFHVILVDNGRSDMLGTNYQSMLRCIRCGACMNHCPVYSAVGGKTYGWVYPGPMGAVLTPNLAGLHNTDLLPEASTSCGRCEEVCPVKIPLPDMMRQLKEEAYEQKVTPEKTRLFISLWAFFATKPILYRWSINMLIWVLHTLAGKKGYLKFLPLTKAWTTYRYMPAPQKKSFQALWKANKQQLKGVKK